MDGIETRPCREPTALDASEAIAVLGLDGFDGTPLALEVPRLVGDEPWVTVTLAGLQYYEYGLLDPVLERLVMPAAGDRLNLVRRPENRADGNAIEIWWDNGHRLGHIPRGTAAVLAPMLDRGEPCRGYVWKPSSGTSWSLHALLVGQAVAGLHRRRIVGTAKLAVTAAARLVWGEADWTEDTYAMTAAEAEPSDMGWQRMPTRTVLRRGPPRPAPTAKQAAAAAAWEAEAAAIRTRREADAFHAFDPLLSERPPLPAGNDIAPAGTAGNGLRPVTCRAGGGRQPADAAPARPPDR